MESNTALKRTYRLMSSEQDSEKCETYKPRNLNRSTGKLRHDVLTKILQVFPDHIVEYILCDLLHKKDLINLSATSSNVRLLMIPLIFTHIKVSWNQLVKHYVNKSIDIFSEIPFHPDLFNLRVTDVSLKYEWSFPFHLLKEVNSLTMKTSKSTNFFKYFPQDNTVLQELKLSCMASDDPENYSTLQGLNPLHSRSDVPPVFNLEHLNKFKALKSLVLQNYSIEYFEPMTKPESDTIDADKMDSECDDTCSLPCLATLKLINCCWEYPFDLLNFDCGALQEIEHSILKKTLYVIQ
ncbi:hypothetical protein ACO0QE_002182 [Hanseniaspora vineae]